MGRIEALDTGRMAWLVEGRIPRLENGRTVPLDGW